MEHRRPTVFKLMFITIAVGLALVIIDGCQEMTGIGPDIHYVPLTD